MRWLVSGCVVSAVVMLPSRAEPCVICFGSDVRAVGDPTDVPSNVLLDTTIPDDLEVTVDGLPAAVVPVPFEWWPESLVPHVPVLLDPEPPGGSSIVLDYQPKEVCFGDAVPPVLLVVGPPDVDPPAPPTGLTYDVPMAVTAVRAEPRGTRGRHRGWRCCSCSGYGDGVGTARARDGRERWASRPFRRPITRGGRLPPSGTCPRPGTSSIAAVRPCRCAFRRARAGC